MKYFTRLRLGLNHLCDHKFDSSCGLDIETTCHYLLHFPSLTNERTLLLNYVPTITKDALASCETTFVKLLLYAMIHLTQRKTL